MERGRRSTEFDERVNDWCVDYTSLPRPSLKNLDPAHLSSSTSVVSLPSSTHIPFTLCSTQIELVSLPSMCCSLVSSGAHTYCSLCLEHCSPHLRPASSLRPSPRRSFGLLTAEVCTPPGPPVNFCNCPFTYQYPPSTLNFLRIGTHLSFDHDLCNAQ